MINDPELERRLLIDDYYSNPSPFLPFPTLNIRTKMQSVTLKIYG